MMAASDDFDFEDPRPDRTVVGPELVLSVEGFEGPLDVLLMLARTQKVDLREISILALVEQYLTFMEEATRLELELAADYLVMAAWLAYLKSRLLLPEEEDEEEPSATELALRLQLRLQRLEAMREAGAALMSRNRLGRDVMARGAPEGIRVIRHQTHDCTLYELLKGYASVRTRHDRSPFRIQRRPIFSLEEALERLSALIGDVPDWTDLVKFLPTGPGEPALRRSELASMFTATLELAHQGRADIRQKKTYGPLMIRARRDKRD